MSNRPPVSGLWRPGGGQPLAGVWESAHQPEKATGARAPARAAAEAAGWRLPAQAQGLRVPGGGGGSPGPGRGGDSRGVTSEMGAGLQMLFRSFLKGNHHFTSRCDLSGQMALRSVVLECGPPGTLAKVAAPPHWPQHLCLDLQPTPPSACPEIKPSRSSGTWSGGLCGPSGGVWVVGRGGRAALSPAE